MPSQFRLLLSTVLAMALSLVVVTQSNAQEPFKVTDAKSRRALLGSAKTWAYQLRIVDLAPLAASNADLLVIDHGYAARQNGKLIFDAADVARLKIKPDGSRRIVLAYMSIGEAEQYRFYWQGDWCKRATAPAWMGAVNPAWPGNYPVRFWDPAWQQIILAQQTGYLAHIKAQGFDGVYLDRTDVYGEWLAEHPAAEKDMVVFLGRIAEAARSRDPSFLVVMQNAEELLMKREVRRLLDGVAKEDLLYGADFSEAANEPEAVASSLKDLRRARTDGIPVFAVEYVSDPAAAATAYQRLIGFSFLPYVAPRLLDRLAAQPGDGQASSPVQPAAKQPPSRPIPAIGAPSWAEGAPTCLLD